MTQLPHPERRGLRSTVVACALVALCVTVILVALENVALAAFFPHLARFTTDFSSAYLSREIDAVGAGPPATVILGDSVLWGYRLPASEIAVSLLAAQGCTCPNFSFKSGSPANDYALMRLFVARKIRPRVVVIEVNQAVLNQADSEYQTLHPAIAALAGPLLSPRERALLTMPPAPGQLERAAASLSLLYAMRSDIRETVFGDVPPPPAQPLTPDLFEGTYDLAPLNAKNVGVTFLAKTADALRLAGIPAVAFLTPTNHALLHDYIDNRQYDANETLLTELLQRRGMRVVNLDRAVPTAEFLDNAHLTAPGQQRLAALLAAALPR
jgi:hypothetical protein